MSTTVTYKGSTLTTVNNQTRTLKTAGKYMEGDVILTDTSAGAATIESLNVTPSESAQTFNSSSVDGYKPVTVSAIKLQNKSVTPIEEEQIVIAGENHDITFSKSGAPTRIGTSYTGYYIEELDTTWMEEGTTYHVTGSVAYCGYNSGITKDYTVDTNYTFDGTSDFSLATTNVKFEMQSEGLKITVPISNAQGDRNIKINGELTFTNASNGYDGLKQVTVEAIPSMYVGNGIDRRSSTDLTASDATVSVPAGYYNAAASKSIDNASLTFNSITNNEPSVASTNNKLTFTADVDVRTAGDSVGGYVASGQQVLGTVRVYLYSDKPYFNDNSGLTTSGATVTVPAGYYRSSVSKSVSSGSATGPTSLSGSSASVSTGTNTLTLTKTGVTTTPTVSAGYVSSATASTATVSLTASVTTKAAATITPTTTNQTIASGTYLTGTQTIAGDADLVGDNILSTANIFGVQGEVVVQNYYTGSSAPSSSLGQNGDIYIQQ